MFTPSAHAPVRPFYAFGNTPAVSQTGSVPQGLDADILLLGCGDVRQVLYTCYAERGLPKRKLDFTTCDIDVNIIARNIMLMSLALGDNDSEAITSEQMWNIYYHLYLSKADLQLLSKQAEKLLALSGTMTKWMSTSYGAVIRFVDENTFWLVRDVWSRLVQLASQMDEPQAKKRFENYKQATQEYNKKIWGNFSVFYTSARSAAPLGATLFPKLFKTAEQYWRTGTSDPTPHPGETFPNPMFGLDMSGSRPLALGDPLLSFHLAPAEANLTDLSPLRLSDQVPEQRRIFEAAQMLFKEWTSSFKELAGDGRIVVRLTAADCHSLCQTLQHFNSTGQNSGNWYQRESSFQVLTLTPLEYCGEEAPKEFDVIDTSNLGDYSGALNLLASAGPLLKDAPWSSLYTELLSRDKNVSDTNSFEWLLCDRTSTVALLLGFSPIEYWTDAKAVAIVDEVLAAMNGHSSGGGVNIQTRLAWKLDRYLSGTQFPARRLRIMPDDLVAHAYHIYLKMFEHQLMPTSFGSAENDSLGRNPFPKYHQGTFVAYLKAILRNVQTDAEEVGRQLITKLATDTNLAIGSNHFQAFCNDLSAARIWTDPQRFRDIKNGDDLAPFCKWKEIPPFVAVTIVVPAVRWQPVYRLAREKGSLLVLEGNLRSIGVANTFHDIYSDCQVAFGSVATEGSSDDDDFKIAVNEDKNGWSGDSPLIATFTVSTKSLQLDMKSTNVSLSIAHSPQAVTLFVQKLGMELSIFQGSLLDQDQVYITKRRPGQAEDPVVYGSGSRSSHVAEKEDSCTTFTVVIDSSTGKATGITGRLNITSEKGNNLLTVVKAPVALEQTSPFTIDVIFGKKRDLVLSLTYPVPVSKEHARTRIARTSGYVEIISRAVHPLEINALEDFIFPTVLDKRTHLPATLNIPHLSMDTLPILSIEDHSRIQFLRPMGTFFFSARELALRMKVQSSARDGLAPSPRLNFKESLFSMLMLASGLQGGQSGLFALSRPSDGVHILLFVSAIRLDGPAASIVIDAAVLPLTYDLVASHAIDEFLLVLRTLQMVQVTVDDKELALWKKVLPAYIERCRTWQHSKDCEYKSAGTIPMSTGIGKPFICSCGKGKFPKEFSFPIPEWDVAAKYATRIAISIPMASPLVENVVDPELEEAVLEGARGEGVGGPSGNSGSSAGGVKERCRACGSTEGTLKACARCKSVKYCGGECQKKDWKKHRMECEEA